MNGKITIHRPQRQGSDIILSATLKHGMRSWTQHLWVHGTAYAPDDLDNSADVWAVLFLFKMMELGGEFSIDAPMSASLHANVDRYARSWLLLAPETCRSIKLTPLEIADDSAEPCKRKALACFSGGLDACFTAYRHAHGLAGAQNQEIDACLMIHGADIRRDYVEEWEGAATKARLLVEDLGIPHFYTITTDFRDMHCPYGYAYFTMLAACMRVFGKQYGHLMLGSDNSVDNFAYPWGNNPVTNHFLSSRRNEIITDGEDFIRTEKAALVARWPMALEHLRCCYSGNDLSRNCGHCPKCLRTRLNFLAAGVTELPCMPPLEDEGMLERVPITSEVEHLELTMLTRYLDRHPLHPAPAWEKALRNRLSQFNYCKEGRPALAERMRRSLQRMGAHIKLAAAKAQIRGLLESDATGEPLQRPDEVMRTMHRLIDSGRALSPALLIPQFFHLGLHHRGADPAPYVFTEELSPYLCSIRRALGGRVPDMPELQEKGVPTATAPGRQHPLLTALHPHGPCPLMLVTAVFSTGKPSVLAATLVMGDYTCNVQEDGSLCPLAVPVNYPRTPAVAEHPASHAPFAGTVLPFWREAQELVCRAHSLFPRTFDIAWELALTPEGPVITGVREDWDAVTPQWGRGMRPLLDCRIRPEWYRQTKGSKFKFTPNSSHLV